MFDNLSLLDLPYLNKLSSMSVISSVELISQKCKMPFTGAPVPAEDLPSKRKTGEDFLEDPRPPKYRNTGGYNDYVRNCILNHCSSTSQDIAMRYLYERADIQVKNV